MADVTLALLPHEYGEYARLNAPWLLTIVTLTCATLEIVLPLSMMLVTLLELCCALVGAFVRHHTSALDRVLHPPYGLAVVGGLCILAFLGRLASATTTMLVYAAFTLVGYTLVATVENRKRQMSAYRAHSGRQ